MCHKGIDDFIAWINWMYSSKLLCSFLGRWIIRTQLNFWEQILNVNSALKSTQNYQHIYNSNSNGCSTHGLDWSSKIITWKKIQIFNRWFRNKNPDVLQSIQMEIIYLNLIAVQFNSILEWKLHFHFWLNRSSTWHNLHHYFIPKLSKVCKEKNCSQYDEFCYLQKETNRKKNPYIE